MKHIENLWKDGKTQVVLTQNIVKKSKKHYEKQGIVLKKAKETL